MSTAAQVKPSALETPPPAKVPIYRKVWAATAGAGGGAAVGLLAAAQPLANLTYQAWCTLAGACPEASVTDDIAILYTILLTIAGTFVSGYMMRERAWLSERKQ